MRRRPLFARLLLVLYALILSLSVFHIHADYSVSVCDDCLHHVHHAAHFTQTGCQHGDCVICNFLQLVYLTTVAVATLSILFPYWGKNTDTEVLLLRRPLSAHYLRGPPVL